MLVAPRSSSLFFRRVLQPQIRSSLSNSGLKGPWSPGLQIRTILSATVMKRLEVIKSSYHDVNQQIMDGSLTGSQMTKAMKEASRLNSTVEIIDRYQDLLKVIEEAKQLKAEGEDPELVEMAEEEKAAAEEELPGLEARLLRALLPRDEADACNAILEVHAGTGGEEASLFTFEIFEMYRHYARLKGWTFEELSVSKTDYGGLKVATASLQGDDVFSWLKYEMGVHRVQRVPVTESSGRLHTSAMSVAVLPEPEDIQIDIKPQDLRIDTYRAGGAGGQHVNTTDSAVRITHIPTGIVVAIQDERSQHQNKQKAMKVLKARVFEAEMEKQQKERDQARKQQLGSGDRSERIRTYNYAQDRVTDHRISMSKFGIEAMLRGEFLDEFVEALTQADKDAQLEAFLATLDNE